MTNQSETDNFSHKALEATIKIGLVLVLLTWCFHIAAPFIHPFAWGVIIAVAIYPLHQKNSTLLGGRKKLSAVLITVVLLLILLGPCVMLANIIGDNMQELAQRIQNQSFSIPPPTDKVNSWPIIGKPLFQLWQTASTDLGKAINQMAPQLKIMTGWLISSGASTLLTILQMFFAVIISGILLVKGASGRNLAVAIGRRVMGQQGEELTELSIATIRGVARGVLGVAVIQSVLAGIGFYLAHIPGAGILTLVCLVIAIVQLPTFILFLPVIAYVFSIHDPLFAAIFMVWTLAVGSLDNILKPLLMGHGVNLPMLVIFIGAIGGMAYSGIIGLFVGAVVLALGYKLFLSWLDAA